MLDAEGANLGTFTQYGFAAHHHMFVDECFLAPLLHTGVNLKGLAIGGRANKFGLDFSEGCANDAGGLHQLAPWLNAALHKEVQ